MLVWRVHLWVKNQPGPRQEISTSSTWTFFSLDSIELLEDMLTPLTIFDLDPRVTPPKKLQVIWCNCDVEYIRRIKDCVLKSVGDIKNSSNDILWGWKIHARKKRTETDDGGKWFSEVSAADLGSDIGTLMRLKIPHVFAIMFYFWWYEIAQEFLISGEILNWESHSENICKLIIIIPRIESTYSVMEIWVYEELFNVRGCRWFLCEEIIVTNNYLDLIKVSPDLLDIGQVRSCSSSEVYLNCVRLDPILMLE